MNSDKQIEQLQRDKKDLIQRLEQERADKHEEAARIGDALMKLSIGRRQ